MRYSSVFVLTDVYNSAFIMETTFSLNDEEGLLQPVQLYCTVNFEYLHTHTLQMLSRVVK